MIESKAKKKNNMMKRLMRIPFSTGVVDTAGL